MSKLVGFYKKYNNYIFYGILAIVLFVPQVRMPVQVFVQRLISFSPSEIAEEKRERLLDYDFVVFQPSGEQENFSKSKGRVVLVNFWATWCPPCVAELPSLEALYKDYAGKIDFYFITNEEPELVNRFLEKKNFNIPFYIGTTKMPELLNSNALPTTYLIDKEGYVVMKETGAANWHSSEVKGIIEKAL